MTRSPGVEFVRIEIFDKMANRQSGPNGPPSFCEHLHGGGMGSLGLSLTLAPNYNEHTFPYVLVKEDTNICLLEPFENLYTSLITFAPGQYSTLDT